MNPVAQAAQHHSIGLQIKQVITYPYRKIVELVQYVVRKFFGFLLRLSVFQLAEYKNPVSYFFMRTFQILSCDPRERDGISQKRLNESESLLFSFGGIEGVAHPEDGNAQVRYIHFTPERAFARIVEMGGEKRALRWLDPEGNIEERFAIFPAPGTSPQQFEKLVKGLKKFGLPSYDRLQDNEGNVEKGVLLPVAPTFQRGETGCILRFHSPGRSMLMDRKFLRWIFAGCSACITDSRGILKSTGEASEGGYYLDAEAVYKKLLDFGYRHNEIFVSGYCEGAAIGAHLVKKYHHLGTHFIAENPFNTLYDMVKHYNFFGRHTADYIFPEIQSEDEKITSLIDQDGFDNEKKLANLAFSTGKFIIVHSQVDKTNPPQSAEKLVRAIGENAGPVFVHKRIHPNPKFDAHMQPPSEDEKTWRWMAHVMSS